MPEDLLNARLIYDPNACGMLVYGTAARQNDIARLKRDLSSCIDWTEYRKMKAELSKIEKLSLVIAYETEICDY